jgi:L-histidine Nalpha-methyltransferase
VRLGAADLTLDLLAGEEIRTEISAKYTRERVEALLTRTGFAPHGWHTDARELFALSLARRD